MSKTERQQYKIAGPATWELIRAAYLGGESARALAERFGVSEHAIRKRISVEKWTKRDYAAALEARGVVREKQKPNFIEEGVLREEMRVAAEAREASAREAELSALVEQIASQDDAAGIAAALERRALAQASAAMVQGRSKEAQALASMAEMMRKRVVAASAPLPGAAQFCAARRRRRRSVAGDLGSVSARMRRGEARGHAKAFAGRSDA
jgi:transposase